MDNQSETQSPIDKIPKNLRAEVFRQNWENARYHESTRWKYIYYYYFVIAAYLALCLNEMSDSNFDFASASSSGLAVFGIVWILIAVVGRASFYHLLHYNIEYGNYVKAVEFIARDLGINVGITEYRKGDKGVRRYTYAALPLGLGVRDRVPFLIISIAGVCFSIALGIICFTFALVLLIPEELFTPYSALELWGLRTVGILVGILVLLRMRSHYSAVWKQFEKAKKEELLIRDPMKDAIADG